MHSTARHRHGAASATTKGLIMNGGVGYDLMGWFWDTFMFRGQWRTLRRQTIALARLQPGEQVLDVGCGTGTLAIAAQRAVGRIGHVVGIDPSEQQIARARAKAARRHLPADFQIGVIEQLVFPDQSFDVVFSTLMMHHLPAPLKRQGVAEIARVLKPGGRFVIADFTHKQERQDQATHFHAGGSKLDDLLTLVQDAGFTDVATRQIQPVRFSAFPGASVIRACKGS